MDWPSYLMGAAIHAATKSKDTTQVGAVLVTPRRRVICTAYNGPPQGVRDIPERFIRPPKYLYAAHAESNLIATAASEGIRTAGCDVYVTHMPCSACARLMIQAGVAGVFFGPGVTSMPAEEFEAARTMFEEAGVTLSRIEGGA